MKIRWSIRILVILMPVLAVASCIYLPIPPVNDLKLVSVDVVAPNDIPAHDKYWNDGEIAGPLVRITFSSGYDFQTLAKGWNYYVGQRTAYCNGAVLDAQSEMNGFPNVYDRLGPVDEYAGQQHLASAEQRGRILYHVYFDAEQHGNVNWKPYDLIHQPQDVCIQMNGHHEIAGEIPTVRFKSNVLIVRKEELTAALARAGLRQH